MYVYKTYNPIKDETDTITAPDVIELCANILDYNNNIDHYTNKEYIVIFNDGDGNTIIEITEDGLYLALAGKNSSEITDLIKNDNVKYINFTNPVRMGEAEWDENYEKSDDDTSDDSESEEESQTNIVQLA